MLDFLQFLLVGEDHASAYVWAAVALAHAMIGVLLFTTVGLFVAALLADAWVGVAVVALGYWLFETLQLLSGASLADCLLDWSAVTLGACIAGALWGRRGARPRGGMGAGGVGGRTQGRSRRTLSGPQRHRAPRDGADGP